MYLYLYVCMVHKQTLTHTHTHTYSGTHTSARECGQEGVSLLFLLLSVFLLVRKVAIGVAVDAAVAAFFCVPLLALFSFFHFRLLFGLRILLARSRTLSLSLYL